MGEKLRVCIVGVGVSGAMHAAALRDVAGAELVAIAGVHANRVQAFAAKWGIPRCYDRVEDAVADPRVDVVHLCTPPFLHEPQAVAAATAGKHVLIEKPIARTVGEADRIVAAARQAGVTLGGIFQHRFMPLPRLVKDAIKDGKLGRLYVADAYVKWWRDVDYYLRSPWRGTRQFEGGGALINQAIHTIDLLLWLAGPVERVSGEIGTLAHGIEMEDTAVAALRFASGAMGVVEAATTAWPGFAERVELHGEGGSVVLNEGEGWIEWRLRGEEPRRQVAVVQQSAGSSDPTKISLCGHPAVFRDFYQAIREHCEPAVTGQEARRALEVVQAIQISGTRGGPVRLPL